MIILHKIISMSMVLFATLLLFFPISYAEEITGLQIMTNRDQREDGDDQTSEARFTLINKRGQKRIRETIRYWKDYDGKDGFDEKMVIFFKSPPDIKNTGFLNWSYIDIERDDDKWLYLPALKKVRRISAGDKEDSFMGTDFTFDDMGDRKVEEDRHHLIKSDSFDGRECYVVESTPKDKDYMYSKQITWVDKERWVDLKTEYYDRKSRLLKTLITKWQQVNNIWSPKSLHMENHRTGHQTTIDISDVKFNIGLKESIFKKARLKRGIKR
ncbi:MAG: outer membrane lipoprotein-sorting protein [Nitrospirota bacterium]